MMVLYVKTGCPFCGKVLKKIEELGIEECFEKKNIADDGVVDELVELGGKKMVPYLIDAERGNAMYESGDIVAYLEEHYGKGESGEEEESPKVCT